MDFSPTLEILESIDTTWCWCQVNWVSISYPNNISIFIIAYLMEIEGLKTARGIISYWFYTSYLNVFCVYPLMVVQALLCLSFFSCTLSVSFILSLFTQSSQLMRSQLSPTLSLSLISLKLFFVLSFSFGASSFYGQHEPCSFVGWHSSFPTCRKLLFISLGHVL